MTSATLLGWEPATPNTYARPVQDEDATLGLTGCETPDGHGLAVWIVSGEVHFATLNAVQDLLVDDVVPTGDIQTMMTADVIFGAAVFATTDGPRCVVSSNTSNTYSCEVYEPDDPNEPTSWSVLSTPYTAHAGGSAFGNGLGAAPPLILDGGRWVLSTKTADGPGDNSFQAWHFRIFTSDDDGGSWTQRLDFEHTNIFPRTEFAATQMAQDPVTGYLWSRSGTSISTADQNILWKSEDDGTTWAHSSSDVFAAQLIPAIDNGTNIYALDILNNIWVYDGSGFDFTDWDDTGEAWAAAGTTPDGSFEQTIHVTVTDAGIYFFVRDQVMFVPLPYGWHWGGIRFGTGRWT